MQPLIAAQHVRQSIADFLATSFPGTTPGFDGLIARFLAEPGNVSRGPYVTISLPFRKMPAESVPFEWLHGFEPHAHQARAFARLTGTAPLSTLVATGTGSGKTECFLYPVLEHCRLMRAARQRGIKAILIYPMNALATDQAGRVAREILTHPALAGITAGLYVGEESGEKSTSVRHLDGDRYTVITDRNRLREEPPDVLLTNYKMLDFLLIRAKDSVLWRHNRPDTLRYLVVDELHSFDGAQGTDLACLVRRLKARLKMAPGGLACVGTSATMGSEGAEPLLHFARDIFAESFDAQAVIGEDRKTVAEYLQDSTVEHVLMPSAADYVALSPLAYASAPEYVAAQYTLWFGSSATPAQVEDAGFLVELGRQLKQHVAFQNLLRDLHRLGGRAVALDLLTDAPIMVVLGNPPYSGHSANTGTWISGLLHGTDSTTGKKTGNYFEVDGEPLGERQPKWLNDDYVKFIRFAQWRIEQTGYGVLAFITNNGYLENPTFRGMRQSLLNTFDELYVLDLHGSSKKKSKGLDGGKDENVFDIQQGVGIGIFIKRQTRPKNTPKVFHAGKYGTRAAKYQWLLSHDLKNTKWTALKPQSPAYLLVPRDNSLLSEYELGWKLTDAMPVNNVGILSGRDALTIRWDEDDIWRVVKDFLSLPVEEAREKYELGKDAQDWQVARAQEDLKSSGPSKGNIRPILYRPFDRRFTYYTGKSRGFHCRPGNEVMRQMTLIGNLGLGSTRSVEIESGWEHMFVTNSLFTHHTVSVKEVNYLFPLYIVEDYKPDLFKPQGSKNSKIHPNYSPEFLSAISSKIGLKYDSTGTSSTKNAFGPTDVFNYAYAVFYSPGYRSRYAQFLKADYPRLPLTSDAKLFKTLVKYGGELISLHLMESQGKLATTYPVAGDNKADVVKYVLDGKGGGEFGSIKPNILQMCRKQFGITSWAAIRYARNGSRIERDDSFPMTT